MKKKIIIIGPGMEIGGVERSLLGLLDSIDYEKYEVDLFLMAHTGEFMPLINKKVNLLPEYKEFAMINTSIINLFRAKNLKIALIRLFSKVYGDIKAKITCTETLNITICKKIVSRMVPALPKQYDLALGFFGPHYFLEEKVSAKLKIGWVHTDYSNSNEKPDINYMLPMWDGMDFIACVSQQVKESFDSLYPTLQNKTIVIENILSAEFVKKQAEVYKVKNEMPDDNSIKILSVGRFCTQKAFDEAVVACSILVQKGYKLRWYLIGYGPDENLIRNKIKEYKMEKYVIILGKKDNPYPYIKECDIYVQPSRYEGKAVTVREAQILNKPVMITRFATSSSQLEEGVDGYICEMGVDGIATGLEFMLNNEEFCKELSSNTSMKNYGNVEEVKKVLN